MELAWIGKLHRVLGWSICSGLSGKISPGSVRPSWASMAMAWRISSYGTWCCALSFIVLLAGCDEGLDVFDAFFVQFVVRLGNRDGLDRPGLLGLSL